MNKQDIKAILFDLDGTLCKSEWLHFIAWNKALKNFNIKIDPSLFMIYNRRSPQWIENDIKLKSNANFQEGDLIKEKDRIFIELFGESNSEDNGLMPYAYDAVKFFYDNSFMLAVCTSGSRDETILKLKNGNIEKYFNAIFSADDVEFPKPAPDIYKLAIDSFKLTADQCLVIEDTESGLIAAKEAGAFCFVVPTEYSQKQNFEKANKVLTSLKDLIIFFK
ncbi:MAG: HAD family phosphatase [Candidatus Paceibacterota bacterium]